MRRPLIPAAALAGALAGLAAMAGAEEPGPDQLAFSVANMDLSADPAADFYRYSAGGWLDRVARPPEYPAYGIFTIMTERLTRQVAEIAADAARAADTAPKGSPAQIVGDFYTAFMDEDAIDAAGIQPIRAMLDEVAAAGTLQELTRIAARHAAAAGPALLAQAGPGPDPADNSRHAIFVLGQDFGVDRHFREILRLPAGSPQMTAYRRYIRDLLAAAGYDPAEAERIADLSVGIEAQLYSVFLSPAEAKVPANRYGRSSYEAAKAQVPEFDLDLYLDTLGFPRPGTVYMYEPHALEGLAALLQTVPIAALKDYFAFRLIHGYAPFLDSRLRAPALDFEEAMLGARQDRPRRERLYQLFLDRLGHPASQLYVERAYAESTRAELLAMIDRIRAVFRRRIADSPWLSAPTRQEALRKIDQFSCKVGYPDAWIDFGSVEIGPRDPVANILALGRFEMERERGKLAHPPVHDAFNARSTLPIAMNAAYLPVINGFELTAAITQPPAFAPEMDAALKFCRIGAIIGHEMTHGFDFAGRQYDADGNFRDWWTPGDAQAFLAEAQKLVEQADAYEVLPGLHVNGALGVGENMADAGGISLAYEALTEYLAEHPEEDVEIDGLSPARRCFAGWTQFWAMKATAPYLEALVANDGHAPDAYRAVAALQHVDAFYEVFGIEEGDPMWLPPEKRARAW
ncbi:M13 family metallopeptidase [Poseidonocella sp. HB161398]|uniref:M13 family metallopeptidase n=1 Tax=Poseidonocella sp. HB161398 TaxID=2320855 RepID=UPI001109E0CB|nr:M13 family metallopeptidase [Poseidonocella sp. HB161398]